MPENQQNRRKRTGYRTIAAHYRTRITNGDLRPGDHLPTVRAAMNEWGVSMQTISRAYSVLRQEGLTHGSTGAGTVVALRPSTDLAARVAQHALTGTALAADERSEILDVREVGAPESIASRLGIAPGERVWMRQRRVTASGSPTHISTSYYPRRITDVTPELTGWESTGGSRELAAERLGVPQSHVLEEVYPTRAEPHDAQLLGIGVGDPLVSVIRTVWLADSTVVEVATKLTHRSLRWSSAL